MTKKTQTRVTVSGLCWNRKIFQCSGCTCSDPLSCYTELTCQKMKVENISMEGSWWSWWTEKTRVWTAISLWCLWGKSVNDNMSTQSSKASILNYQSKISGSRQGRDTWRLFSSASGVQSRSVAHVHCSPMHLHCNVPHVPQQKKNKHPLDFSGLVPCLFETSGRHQSVWKRRITLREPSSAELLQPAGFLCLLLTRPHNKPFVDVWKMFMYSKTKVIRASGDHLSSCIFYQTQTHPLFF